MVIRGRSTAGIIAACVMLTLLALLAACGPDPTPTPVPPTPTVTPTPSSTLSPSPSPLPTHTPSPTATPRPLRPNPRVRTRLDDLAAPLRPVVDGTYCTPAWNATTLPATLAIPIEPVRGDLLLEWNSSANSPYVSAPGTPTYGLPESYTIATSADSTDGKNGIWLEVASVKGNTARTREHRFSAAGARWVRMTVTRVVPGPLGNTLLIDEIDLHDASDGTEDSVFFMGDSITAASFARCPANQPSFAALVHLNFSGRYPAMIDGGVGGVNSGYGVSMVQDWLSLNPDIHIWAIAYGTNDAWQTVPAGLFEQQMQTIVERIKAAGRIPVMARMPFALKGPTDENVRALNRAIDRVAAHNKLLPGPDLYAWFRYHPDELGPDGVHPSDAGTLSINRLWYAALRPLYGSGP